MMADVLKERALLVPDEQVLNNLEHIPYPEEILGDKIDLDDFQDYDIKELYKSNKKATLACGPDTISLQHIQDLMPSIEGILNIALNKREIRRLPHLVYNYARLIPKEKVPEGKEYTKKQLRPIGEADALVKYGPVKIMAKQLRSKMVPKMQKSLRKLLPMAKFCETFDKFVLQWCKHMEDPAKIATQCSDDDQDFQL